MNISKLKKKNKKRTSRDVAIQAFPSSSSSASSSAVPRSSRRGFRLAAIRRNPRFPVTNRASDAEMIAFNLGMSVAAVMSQVLDRKGVSSEDMSVDRVSKVCKSAVREAIAKVFGEKRDEHLSHFTFQDLSIDSALSMASIKREPSSRSFEASGHLEETASTIRSPEQLSAVEEIQDSQLANCANFVLSLHENMNRKLAVSSSNILSQSNSMIRTFEKSVVEQARRNDLLAQENDLKIVKINLKKEELHIKKRHNFLERIKLSMRVSEAFFKAKQFKNKLEDARHAELLAKCIDHLVAGIVIMSASLGYGAYVYSFKRITDATNSCTTSMDSRSWTSRWIPKQLSSVSSGLQTLSCLFQVFSRMLFSILMILVVTYLLIQRSAASTSRQIMPITSYVLLLGAACGVVGKLFVDALGGNGYHWVIFWEVLCSLHFFANIFTSALFFILYGPVNVTESSSTNSAVIIPFWIRRLVFFLTVLLVLPLLCGLMPFASCGEWMDHFTSLFRNLFLVAEEDA